MTRRPLAALFPLLATLAASACGVDEPVSIARTSAGATAATDLADQPAPAAELPSAVQVIAWNTDDTRVFVLKVQFDDVDAVAAGTPLEAGPTQAVHIFSLGSADVPVGTAFCDRLGASAPSDPGPCVDEGDITILPGPVVELPGVVTLLTVSEKLMTGRVDAFVGEDDEARGNFVVNLSGE